MISPPAPLKLRTLRVSDLPTVLPIEARSFPTPTSESLFRRELTENRLAHHQALLVSEGPAHETLTGYAGYWIMADEVHVTTIAVDPAWRGRGFGEVLLLNMLYEAIKIGAALVTLEVRERNTIAQSLYTKYGFERVGVRRNYYRDTGEAAILMTLPLQERPQYESRLLGLQEALFARLQASSISNLRVDEPPGAT